MSPDADNVTCSEHTLIGRTLLQFMSCWFSLVTISYLRSPYFPIIVQWSKNFEIPADQNLATMCAKSWPVCYVPIYISVKRVTVISGSNNASIFHNRHNLTETLSTPDCHVFMGHRVEDNSEIFTQKYIRPHCETTVTVWRMATIRSIAMYITTHLGNWK